MAKKYVAKCDFEFTDINGNKIKIFKDELVTFTHMDPMSGNIWSDDLFNWVSSSNVVFNHLEEVPQ